MTHWDPFADIFSNDIEWLLPTERDSGHAQDAYIIMVMHPCHALDI